MLSPELWIVAMGIVVISYALTGCASAPKVHPCLWVRELHQFDCEAADGSTFMIAPEDAKNLVCYPPEEDAALMKYCRSK